MHLSVGWWQAWLRGLKGCGSPVSHQVNHVSAVAAEGPIFLFFLSLGRLENITAGVGKGRGSCLPVGCRSLKS